MATINPAGRGNTAVIDLISDSDSEPASPMAQLATRTANDNDALGAQPDVLHPQGQQAIDWDDWNQYLDDPFFGFPEEPIPADIPVFNEPAGRDHAIPLVIDDFSYLDEDTESELEQEAGANETGGDFDFALALQAEQKFTLDDCLQRVLEVFPDVSHDYVTELYNGLDQDAFIDSARLDSVIDKLLSDSNYPRQAKSSSPLKRKREESVDRDVQKRWERANREVTPGYSIGPIRQMLKAEFPEFSLNTIKEIVAQDKYLYKGYLRLAHLRDTLPQSRRGRPSTDTRTADMIAATSSPQRTLTEELQAARNRVSRDRIVRAEEAARERAEAENLQAAINAGKTTECQACFDDLPMNRQIHCSGPTPHFTCYDCIETYIKSEVGESRCKVLCTAGCGANFAYAQLSQLSDKKLLDKLAQLQQEKDIRDANLEDLEDCPFCDFKAILPPIEEDFEFRCANPTCRKVSCRRCKAVSHIPLSCEEHAKDNKLSSRHKIEEAMTAALVRACNKCKKQFIKEYGCNKMTCPSCNNLQCYVCSETLKDYGHFGQRGHPAGGAGGANSPKKCPLYDNVEERHEREVKAAEEAARAEVVADNPDVTAEDLEIKVSDAVKQSTRQRIQLNGPEGLGGGPFGWQDNMMLAVPHPPAGRPVDDEIRARQRLAAMGNARRAADRLRAGRVAADRIHARVVNRANAADVGIGAAQQHAAMRNFDELHAAVGRDMAEPPRVPPPGQRHGVIARPAPLIANRYVAQRDALRTYNQAFAAPMLQAQPPRNVRQEPHAVIRHAVHEDEDEDDDDSDDEDTSSSDDDRNNAPPPPPANVRRSFHQPQPLAHRDDRAANLGGNAPGNNLLARDNGPAGRPVIQRACDAHAERRRLRRAAAPMVIDDSPRASRRALPRAPWHNEPQPLQRGMYGNPEYIRQTYEEFEHQRQEEAARRGNHGMLALEAGILRPPAPRQVGNPLVRTGRDDNEYNPFAPDYGQNQGERREQNRLANQLQAARNNNRQQGQQFMNFAPYPVPAAQHYTVIAPNDVFDANPFPPAQDANLNFRDPFNNMPAIPTIETGGGRNPDIRQARQGFEHLELMRQEHDERMGLRFRPLHAGRRMPERKEQ